MKILIAMFLLATSALSYADYQCVFTTSLKSNPNGILSVETLTEQNCGTSAGALIELLKEVETRTVHDTIQVGGLISSCRDVNILNMKIYRTHFEYAVANTWTELTRADFTGDQKLVIDYDKYKTTVDCKIIL